MRRQKCAFLLPRNSNSERTREREESTLLSFLLNNRATSDSNGSIFMLNGPESLRRRKRMSSLTCEEEAGEGNCRGDRKIAHITNIIGWKGPLSCVNTSSSHPLASGHAQAAATQGPSYSPIVCPFIHYVGENTAACDTDTHKLYYRWPMAVFDMDTHFNPGPRWPTASFLICNPV